MKPLLPPEVETAVYELAELRLLLSCPADSAEDCYERLNYVIENATDLKKALSTVEGFIRSQYAFVGRSELQREMISKYYRIMLNHPEKSSSPEANSEA